MSAVQRSPASACHYPHHPQAYDFQHRRQQSVTVCLQPVILVSNFVTALAGISFGLAGSLEGALTARIIGGLFNGSGV